VAEKKPTLLIDADTLVYAAASANEEPFQWSEWEWTLHSDMDACVAQLEDTVQEIQEGLQTDKIIMALSDGERWRQDVMPEYKGNRKGTRKPVTFLPLREYVREKWNTYQRPRLEGDDVLGILATHPTLIPGKKIIVSIDKDMKTLPCLLSNYSKDRMPKPDPWIVRKITPEQAHRNHMLQTLTGDTTDGYKGCPGVGPVKADKLLEGCPPEKWWEAVVACYKAAGLGEAVALQNAQVSRILQYTDYDFKRKEPILWQSNT
jgi:Autographiviridae exonuclease